MPTMKQIAITELRNATKDYIVAAQTPVDDKTAFVMASLRLHVARGADIPRAYIRESRRLVKTSSPA